MAWEVILSRKAEKAATKLPRSVLEALRLLMGDITLAGPVQGAWPNYGKLGPHKHHCHIKKGRPTYVAVWEVTDNQIRLIEVQYVGTHENAPY